MQSLMDQEFKVPLAEVRQSLMWAKHALGDWVEPHSPNFSLDDISLDDSMVNIQDFSPPREEKDQKLVFKESSEEEEEGGMEMWFLSENEDFLWTKNTWSSLQEVEKLAIKL